MFVMIVIQYVRNVKDQILMNVVLAIKEHFSISNNAFNNAQIKMIGLIIFVWINVLLNN